MYNSMMVFAIYQYEWAIDIHIPSLLNGPPPCFPPYVG